MLVWKILQGYTLYWIIYSMV